MTWKAADTSTAVTILLFLLLAAFLGFSLLGRVARGRATVQACLKGIRQAALNSMPVIPYDPEMGTTAGLPLGNARVPRLRRLLRLLATPSAMLPPSRPWWIFGRRRPAQPPASARQLPSPQLSCSICAEDFARGVDVRRLPCSHLFHPPCVDPWLLDFATTCPICRADFRGLKGHSVKAPAAVLLRTLRGERPREPGA